METPAWAVVELAAVRHNVALLRERAAGAQLMTVVKADAYGHGMVPCAIAALEAGADWLGVAQVGEALRLRAAGIAAPVLCMMAVPGEPYEEAIKFGVDVRVDGFVFATDPTVATHRILTGLPTPSPVSGSAPAWHTKNGAGTPVAADLRRAD